MFATRDSRFRYSNACTVIISLAKHHTICEMLITMIWKLFGKLNLNQSSSLMSQFIPGWLVGWLALGWSYECTIGCMRKCNWMVMGVYLVIGCYIPSGNQIPGRATGRAAYFSEWNLMPSHLLSLHTYTYTSVDSDCIHQPIQLLHAAHQST